MNNRRVAIMEGGDWNDAGVEHILVSDDCDLEAMNHLYNRWYKTIYRPNIKTEKFLTFAEYLIKEGKAERDEEVQEYWPY